MSEHGGMSPTKDILRCIMNQVSPDGQVRWTHVVVTSSTQWSQSRFICLIFSMSLWREGEVNSSSKLYVHTLISGCTDTSSWSSKSCKTFAVSWCDLKSFFLFYALNFMNIKNMIIMYFHIIKKIITTTVMNKSFQLKILFSININYLNRNHIALNLLNILLDIIYST